MTKIYVVEDDEDIRDLVLYALRTEDLDASGFESGQDFFSALACLTPDLIVLDIMLPGEDGLSILKKLKQSSAQIPVIMLTAKGSEYDRVRGLDLGADDYIVKPFSLLEFISRVKAVLRRGKGTNAEATTLSYENLFLDLGERSAYVNGQEIQLTYKEFELLYYMLKNREIALSREKIMNHIWGFDYEGESRTVDMHIKTLRQKLGDGGKWIKTIRCIGYKLGK